MVNLPNDASNDGYIFLMGGLDEYGDPIPEMQIGKLTRTTTIDPDYDPWAYQISIDCSWGSPITLNGYIGLTGQSAVLDPYYSNSGEPRILIFGGRNSNGDLTNSLYKCQLEYDLENGYQITGYSELQISGTAPSAREEQAAALDIREHRLLIHGGFSEEDDVLDDLCSLDMIGLEWNAAETTYINRHGHFGFYNWFTFFGGKSGEGQGGGLMDDIWQYKPDKVGENMGRHEERAVWIGQS